jgi:hypothetical protein
MICEKCKIEHDGVYGSGRFCSSSCARSYSSSLKREIVNKQTSITIKQMYKDGLLKNKFPIRNESHTQETKDKISKSKTGQKYGEMCLWHKEKIRKSLKRYYLNNPPKSILQLSKRTASKIFRRLNKGCSYCGWNEDICDIHHINGKKISDPNNHKNLSYLCPNCHRLVHRGIIPKESIIDIQNYIGDSWKEVYYG